MSKRDHEIIEGVRRIAEKATVLTPGKPFVLSLDDGNMLMEAASLLESMNTISITWEPDVGDWIEELGARVLDECVYKGRTLREWINKVAEEEG